jgi:hypothetical protein
MTMAPEHAPPSASVSPAEVRAGLVPEDQAEFDRDWHEACDQAAETYDLAPIHRTVESYRRRALLVSQLGPDGYRKLLAEADRRLRTGERAPGAVPLDQVKALIAERLGR